MVLSIIKNIFKTKQEEHQEEPVSFYIRCFCLFALYVLMSLSIEIMIDVFQ